MGTKANPGAFDCYEKADDDEPLFVLRAKDPAPVVTPEMIEAAQAVCPVNENASQVFGIGDDEVVNWVEAEHWELAFLAMLAASPNADTVAVPREVVERARDYAECCAAAWKKAGPEPVEQAKADADTLAAILEGGG